MFCVQRREEKLQEQREQDDKDVAASEKIVTNAVFCFLNNGSARTFVKLNDKDQLRDGKHFPTKNDGAERYFKLRQLCNKKLKVNRYLLS